MRQNSSADKEKEKKRKEHEEAKAAKAQKKMMKSVKSQLKCFICNRQKSDLEDLGYAEENTAKDADDITQGSNLEDTELTMQKYSRNDEDYVMKEDTVESGKSAEVDDVTFYYFFLIYPYV
ncbi:hypothetical protein QE152_g24853 [Popillia japonica]|uniref:Uncharacterized protein n=1 Tax=Popillia japonica TaxID=7064 RepID=A0AAW1K471_POPJA